MTKVYEFFLKIMPSKRKLIQLYSALLHNAHLKGFVTGKIFDGPLKNICGPGFNCYSCPGATTACPLGSIQNALAESKTKTPTYVFGIILLYCIILGRTICGYLCPAGLLQELLYKIKTPKLKKSKVTRILSYTKYVLLFVFVIGIPLMYALQENNMPVPGFCKYICPVGTFEGGVFLLIPQSNQDYFAMLGGLFSWKFLIMLLIVLSSIFIYRVFCRFLCPLGAIYGLFNRLSIIGVKVDKSKCTNCHACVNFCKMDVKEVGDHECIMCGECIDVCKDDAIKWKNVIKRIKEEKALEATLVSELPQPINATDVATETNSKALLNTAAVEVKNETLPINTNSSQEINAIASQNTNKTKKSKKSLYAKIAAYVGLIGILIIVLVFTNVDFSKKYYSQNMILDSFTTKLYSEQEYNINNSEARVKLLYFYDVYDKDTFTAIEEATSEHVDSILISKYDNKEEYKSLAATDFAASALIFGYDSVNQTEISKFSETISYPYLVILDKDNKIVVAEQTKYDSSYYTNYIMPLANDVVIGNEVGNMCLTQDIKLISDDSVINISDYLGKIVVLNFWYIECAPCKEELPYFSQVNSEYDEVEVIAVSSNMWYTMAEEDTKAYIKAQQFDLTYAYDNPGESYTIALFGKADAYPMTIIIDQEGYIRYKAAGSVKEDVLRSQIEALLA